MILKPSNNYVAGIFFPIGREKDGGTCQYASDKCLKECYGLNKHHDVTMDIPETGKKDTLDFITKAPILTVCSTIIKEKEALQAHILSWFCTGDCLDKDIERVYQIMLLLHEEGIIQNGFTRNENLYQAIQNDGIIKHIVLTIESKDIKDAPTYDYPNGLWAIPDYDTGTIKLYQGSLAHKEHYYASCNFHNTKTIKANMEEIEIATNCYGCFKHKIGCFINK